MFVGDDVDFGSELVEIKGELDCETEIVDNVAVSGTINIQTDEHHDTVKEAHTSIIISLYSLYKNMYIKHIDT